MTWDPATLDQELGRYLGQPGTDPEDPRERTRRRILDAATEHFVRLGYRKTSVDNVAHRAGVAKGTVYLHFKNKADLLVHAAAAEKARFADRLKTSLDPASGPRERLRRYVEGVLLWVPDMPLLRRLGRDIDEVRHVLDDLDPELRARNEELERQFFHWLLEPFALPRHWTADDLAAHTRTLRAFLQTAPFQTDGVDAMGTDRAEYARLLAGVLADGFAGPEPAG